MPPGFIFSHTTAAVLLGLRLPDGFRESVLHVTSTGAARAPRGRGVVGHRSGRPLTVAVLPNGLRVASPLDVWCQLGGILSLDDLVVMGDSLVRRKQPFATLAQLADALAGWRGLRGYRRLAEALSLVRPRTDSARETKLRLIILLAGFPEPVVNHPIVNRYGAVIAHGDLTYPDYMTLLEYDGGQHREDERQYSIDVARLDEIMEEGWRTIRVDKMLMRKRAVLLGKVDTALRRGGWGG